MPLFPQIEELLLKEKEKQKQFKSLYGKGYITDYLGYICLNPLGEHFKPDFVTRKFKNILMKNDMKVIRFHDLRHSCATMLLAKGVDMKNIQV